MRTFIQLRDGIGYATLTTPVNEPDHSVTPDHTTVIEVFTDNADQFLGKQYNAEANSWSDAPIIRYAELNQNGVPVEIRRTVFAHTVPGDAVIMPDEVDGSWQFINNEWIAPEPPVVYVESTVVEPEPQAMIESPHVETKSE